MRAVRMRAREGLSTLGPVQTQTFGEVARVFPGQGLQTPLSFSLSGGLCWWGGSGNARGLQGGPEIAPPQPHRTLAPGSLPDLLQVTDSVQVLSNPTWMLGDPSSPRGRLL